ncbi:AraC family transcriptional regulator, partial [bacterium]|nr:AraC family transcriptional regulator [bacterium]
RESQPTSFMELVVGGTGVLEIAGARHLLRPGDVFIVHDRDFCRYYAGPSGSWRKLFVSFWAGGVNDIMRLLGLTNVHQVHLSPVHYRLARRLFGELLLCARAKHEQFRDQLSTIVYRLLIAVARDAHPEESHGTWPPLIRRAIRFDEKHRIEPLSMTRLARVAGCTPAYFSTVFARHVGVKPYEWFTRMRIQHAAYVLESTDAPVATAAAAAGYEDPFHFSRLFKRIVGRAPSAHRALFQPADAAGPRPSRHGRDELAKRR